MCQLCAVVSLFVPVSLHILNGIKSPEALQAKFMLKW
ncbi:hypothetical protein TDB9533_03540 [Thalassocella blandensis]|nr:hypothetical protein TDB9533_03540 [Thalassocella blandensis]